MFIQAQNFGTSDSLRYNIQCAHYDYPAHIHHFAELGYVMSGELEVTVGGRVYTAREGDFILIRPFAVHGYRTPQQADAFICAFTGSLVPELFEGETMLLYEPLFRCRESVTHYFQSAFLAGGIDGRAFDRDAIDLTRPCPTEVHTLDLRHARARMQVKSCLYAVLSERLSATGPKGACNGTEPMEKLLLFLHTHYRTPVKLTDAANELGYSANYLSHIIKRETGMGFSEILANLRTDCATKLLARRQGRMIDIALACGFSNERSFNRTFKQLTGYTPSDYVKLL